MVPPRKRVRGAPRAGGVHRVGAGDFVSAVVQSPVPVLVDFYADWCAPCRAIEPKLQRLAKEWGAAARVVKIDADREKTLLRRQRVQSLPTWILFHEGREVVRANGPKDLIRVERKLRALLRDERPGPGPSRS